MRYANLISSATAIGFMALVVLLTYLLVINPEVKCRAVVDGAKIERYVNPHGLSSRAACEAWADKFREQGARVVFY